MKQKSLELDPNLIYVKTKENVPKMVCRICGGKAGLAISKWYGLTITWKKIIQLYLCNSSQNSELKSQGIGEKYTRIFHNSGRDWCGSVSWNIVQ